MELLPRLAVGTVQPGADHHFLTWALIQTLTNAGLQVQSFSCQGCFAPRDASYAITGLRRRYLDSWLMRPDVCAELFRHGSQCADLGLVDGAYDASRGVANGGSLDRLCSTLDIPALVIIDASELTVGCLPKLPPRTVGLLLDKVADVDQLCYLQTTLEALWGVPVLGSLERLPHLRTVADRAGCGAVPTGELCQALASALLPRLQLRRILELAQRPFTRPPCGFFQADPRIGDLHVAVALDEAFTCYFPDTLDVLELLGANVSVFSPLRSEGLPGESDVVYLGCGKPEHFLRELASNVCLKEALWSHILSGRFVYAESAGMAYLAQEIVMPCGRHWPMVGVLPAVAQLAPSSAPPRATTVVLNKDSWLYRAEQQLRGYLNARWVIKPRAGLQPMAVGMAGRHAVLGNHQVVGSRLHVHFAAQPELIEQFVARGQHASLGSIV